MNQAKPDIVAPKPRIRPRTERTHGLYYHHPFLFAVSMSVFVVAVAAIVTGLP